MSAKIFVKLALFLFIQQAATERYHKAGRWRRQAEESEIHKSQTEETETEESQANETDVEESQANETDVEESQAIETDVDESQANETDVEESQANETDVEESQANETDVEESQANETDVDESGANETDVEEETQAEEAFVTSEESFVTSISEENYFEIEEEDEVGSEMRQFNEQRHFVITEKDGKKVNVTFPLIHVSFMERKDKSAKAFIDGYEDFEGIERFQLILQQGDHKGILTSKDRLYTWEDAKKAYEEDGEQLPYITAELKEFGSSPLEFTVGDKMTYGGYYNGELVDDTRKYTIRLRGIVKDKDNEKIIIDTDVVGEIDKPEILTLISAGGASVFLIVIIGFIVSHCLRKRREKQRVARTIAKFNKLLADDNRPADPPVVASTKRDSLPVPRSKSAITSNGSSEWWTQDELEYTAEYADQGEYAEYADHPEYAEYADQYADQSGYYEAQNGEQYQVDQYNDQQYHDHQQYDEEENYDDVAFGAQYSALNAASRLILENDRNIVKRRGLSNAFEGGFSQD